MEKFFNSKFMTKLQEIGYKLANNVFIQSLQAGLGSLLGLITVGSLFQVLAAIGNETALGWFKTGDAVYNTLTLPFRYSMDFISIWVAIFFAYHYAKNLKLKSPIMAAVDTAVTFMLVAGAFVDTEKFSGLQLDYLGSQGMFISFFIVFVVVQIEKFCYEKDIKIKIPDVVPQFLQDSFGSILPVFFSITLFLLLNVGIGALTAGAYNVPSGFMALLRAPLGAVSSVPGIVMLCMLALVLWCFGIHGTLIIIPIISPLGIQAATTNAALHANGQPMQFFPVLLYTSMALVGGTGNTWALVLMGLRSKSKQISAVSKISLIPGWFGINEPVTFGMPIMFNPILCIPYVLNVPIMMILTYFAYQTGFIIPAWIVVSAQLPMGFSNYLTTLRWQNFVWDYILILPAMLIYYPLFKKYEEQLVKQEAEAEAIEAKGGAAA